MEKINLWENTPGNCSEAVTMDAFIPKERTTDGAVIIFPGGAYSHRAEHEGKGYAEFLFKQGIAAFVVNYRVAPFKFPLPLLDARRAIRFVRANALKFNINPDKIAVIGSSAGGHLISILSGYHEKIDFEGIDEIDDYSYEPNYQIFAYPLLALSNMNVSHFDSIKNLLGEEKLSEICNLDMTIDMKSAPYTFMWFTSDDDVNVKNILLYASKLKDLNLPFEMHVFQSGRHGLGLAEEYPHVAQWSKLLMNWLKEIKFIGGIN